MLSMMFFLTSQPLWLSGILVVGLPTLVATAAPAIIRRWVTLEDLRSNNEVAGFKFATVGVLYAVLLAFAVIVVWQKFADAQTVVAQEAGAATTIYHLSDGIGPGPGAAVRKALSEYLKRAIAEDWPAMETGGQSPDVRRALGDIYTTVLAVDLEDNRGAALLAEILHQLDSVAQARRVRLVMAAGVMPELIWLVLIASAALTIGFTFFFGAQNLRAQMLMTGALSVLVFSGLLTIIAIDRPFTGTVSVGPQALIAVLKDMADRP
jgi:hypothetical protein